MQISTSVSASAISGVSGTGSTEDAVASGFSADMSAGDGAGDPVGGMEGETTASEAAGGCVVDGDFEASGAIVIGGALASSHSISKASVYFVWCTTESSSVQLFPKSTALQRRSATNRSQQTSKRGSPLLAVSSKQV